MDVFSGEILWVARLHGLYLGGNW